MKTGVFLAVLVVATCPLLANAGVVTLIDPNFDDVSYTIAFGSYATVNPSSAGAGWFTDGAQSQCRRQRVGAGLFWGSLVGQSGGQAALASQFNVEPVENAGASLLQTVYLETGNTYTLTVGVGTGKGALNGGDGKATTVSKCDAKFEIGFATAPVAPPQNPWYAPPNDYRLTDATLLASTTGISPNLNGVLTDYACSFTPAVSGNYNIALRNRGYVENTGADNMQSTVWFDNVRLTYEPVPEPAAALLLICGGMLFGGRRRHA
jgi:hypothetical protein